METGYLEKVKPFYLVLFFFIGWIMNPFGKWGDVFFFILTIGSLCIGIHFLYKIKFEKMREKEAERLKRILSHQRHNWMNDIQLISGYLSLQKYGRIKGYIEGLIHNTNQERMITQFQYAPLTIALFSLPYRYMQWNIDVKIEDISEITIQDEKNLLHSIESLFPWLEEQFEDVAVVLQLKVTISKKECVQIIIHIQYDTEKKKVLLHDLEEIRKTIRKWNGTITFFSDQQILEIKL